MRRDAGVYDCHERRRGGDEEMAQRDDFLVGESVNVDGDKFRW